MFRSLKKRGCATGGANGQARRRARVEAGGAAELGALEALHALEPAVLEQQPEQAPTTSPMATSEPALLVCDCTESRAHLSAADAVSCHPCDQCGVLAPPTSIAQATACVRDELGLPPVAGSTGAVRSTRSRSVLDAPCRPHGGPALRARVPSELLLAFQKVNGPLGLAGPAHYMDHIPVRIKCACCDDEWFFDFIWDLCHRIELGVDRWAAFADSPSLRHVLDKLQAELPTLLAGVTLPCVRPLVLGWPECFNCEAKRRVCQAHALWQSAASSAVPKLVEMPEHFAGSLVSLGVMSSPQLEVPLDRASRSRHTSTRFKGLNAKVFLRRCVLTLGGGHWHGSGQPCSSTHRSPLTAHRSPLTAQPSPPTPGTLTLTLTLTLPHAGFQSPLLRSSPL